jgi:rhodanese-related sulfurtransferase
MQAQPAPSQAAPTIQSATLGESGAKTPEISTEEMRRALEGKSAAVFDVRPPLEFAISHIPGAVNVAQKPGTSKALYISDSVEVERVVGGKKFAPIILYCNGPFCGKSKRLSEDLLSAGFTNVRRYQLGIPVWRALGGVTQIEAEGVRYVFQKDGTAVWLDTRTVQEFKKGSLPSAKRIGIEVTHGGKDNPAMQQAKNDGTLPENDHNTRIIVFGDDPQAIQAIGDAIAKEAFHNVAFFVGTYTELSNAIK